MECFFAPWFDLIAENLEDGAEEVTAEWVNTPIDFSKIKQFTENIHCIFSDDDYYVALEQADKFKKLLDAKIITVHQKGHISGEDGITELEDILQEIRLVMNK